MVGKQVIVDSCTQHGTKQMTPSIWRTEVELSQHLDFRIPGCPPFCGYAVEHYLRILEMPRTKALAGVVPIFNQVFHVASRPCPLA